jgi:hypothetical protein
MNANNPDSVFSEFIETVMRNLGKNGFPENAVSFPMERMYEEADKRGFSFNKVRDHLRGRGVESELVNDKVVFRAASQDQSGEPDFGGMRAAAEKLLGKLSPDDREKLMKMVRDMSPDQMEAARKQWESMSPAEKQRVVDDMSK